MVIAITVTTEVISPRNLIFLINKIMEFTKGTRMNPSLQFYDCSNVSVDSVLFLQLLFACDRYHTLTSFLCLLVLSLPQRSQLFHGKLRFSYTSFALFSFVLL